MIKPEIGTFLLCAICGGIGAEIALLCVRYSPASNQPPLPTPGRDAECRVLEQVIARIHRDVNGTEFVSKYELQTLADAAQRIDSKRCALVGSYGKE